MKTTALRIHGKDDLRLSTFELPEMGKDEILAKVVSDSLCMSSYKAAIQGPAHKRVPENCAEVPPIIGHEMCGEIIAVGEKWQSQYKPGDRFIMQTALGVESDPFTSPGYSFPYVGGCATYILIPDIVMSQGCLIKYTGDAFFYGSLSEPVSCIIGGFHTNYHTRQGVYHHQMGIKKGGNMAILAGVGPMGLGAIDYAIHVDPRPSLLVVTDIDQARIDRAASLLTVEEAAKNGVKLVYMNTKDAEASEKAIMDLTGGKGYDDVFVYAPVAPVVEMGDRILGYDGCLNFFAGPTNKEFSAKYNFYNVHYGAHHICGNSGGNTDDMREAADLSGRGVMNPAAMITHVGGIDSAAESTMNLPNIKGGKKLIYTHIHMPLTAIDDFAEKGKTDPMYAKLAELCEKHNGLWNGEAEKYLLSQLTVED